MSKYYKVQKTTVKSAGKEIKLLILKPTKNRRPREETPGILWIHGGGYITGMAEMVYISRAMALVKKIRRGCCRSRVSFVKGSALSGSSFGLLYRP